MIKMRWSCSVGILLLITSVAALYEDQAGLLDWHKENVGKVKFVHFHNTPQKKLLFIGSESNVIAALHTKSGDIYWRRILPQDEILHLLIYSGKELLSLSGPQHRHLTMWSLEGMLLWEQLLPPQSALPQVLIQNSVVGVRIESGKVLGFEVSDGTPTTTTINPASSSSSSSSKRRPDGAVVAVSGGGEAVVTPHPNGSLVVEVVGGGHHDVRVTPDRGLPEAAFLDVVAKKNGGQVIKLAMTFQDESFVLMSLGADEEATVVWAREEGLASVVALQFVDMPPPATQATPSEHTPSDVITAFTQRLRQQADRLLGHAKPQDKEDDVFGFSKAIVIASRSGKIFGLSSLTGQVLWSRFHDGRPRAIYLARPPAHYPPVAHILFHSKADKSSLVSINPITGEQLAHIHYDAKIIQGVLLPYTDASYAHLLLLVDSEYKVHTVPSTPEAAQLIADHMHSISFYIVDPDATGITGFSITKAAQGYAARPTWLFTPANESILGVATNPWGSTLGNPGKVMWDRTVRRKYLNPAAVPVLTSSDAGITLYLLDTVAGSVLHQSFHPNAMGPAAIAYNENFVVYHYWNKKTHRFEIAVAEFYYKELQWNVLRYSSWDVTAADIEAIEQAYICPVGVSALGVTNTHRGITTKNILLGTTTDQLVAVDKRFLDPFRPLKEEMSQAEKDEGAVPYATRLPLIHKQFVSYNKTVARIKGIVSVGAHVESTTHVVGWGLDLFYTRYPPAKAFDLLNEDFNFTLLVATTLLLFAVTLVTASLSKRKDLHFAWQ